MNSRTKQLQHLFSPPREEQEEDDEVEGTFTTFLLSDGQRRRQGVRPPSSSCSGRHQRSVEDGGQTLDRPWPTADLWITGRELHLTPPARHSTD